MSAEPCLTALIMLSRPVYQGATDMRYIASLLLLVPAPALSQALPPIQQFDAGRVIKQIEDAKRARAEGEAASAAAGQSNAVTTTLQAQLDAAEWQRAQNIVVGRLISEGKCADAKRVALGEGRFDLVDRVLSLCAPPKASE